MGRHQEKATSLVFLKFRSMFHWCWIEEIFSAIDHCWLSMNVIPIRRKYFFFSNINWGSTSFSVLSIYSSHSTVTYGLLKSMTHVFGCSFPVSSHIWSMNSTFDPFSILQTDMILTDVQNLQVSSMCHYHNWNVI